MSLKFTSQLGVDRRHRAAVAALAAMMIGMAPAAALAIPPIDIKSVVAGCKGMPGKPATSVTVNLSNLTASVYTSLQYEFKNTASGATTTFTNGGFTTQAFLVPPGTYVLRVRSLPLNSYQGETRTVVVPHYVLQGGMCFVRRPLPDGPRTPKG